MPKSVDDLLAQIPQWLGQFTHTLAHPSQVLADQLANAAPAAAGGPGGAAKPDAKPEAKADAKQDAKPEAKPTEGKPVQDGVSFLILSLAVAAGVAVAFPVASMAPLEAAKPQDALTQGATVLRQLFVFLGAAAVVHGGSKLLGNRQAFAGFFGAVARFGGATLVLLALAGALTNVGMADPVVARNWQQIRHTAQQIGNGARVLLCQADLKTGQLPAGAPPAGLDPEQLLQAQTLYLDTVSRPLFLLAGALEGLCLLALSLWLGWVWWRYLRVSGLTPGRALAATAVGAVGLGAGYLLLTLVDSGQMTSQLMQGCP
ncbi:hypothetical protein [Roseateles sp. BYS87W]|uniref:Uncharacterized protein n=1 Tax=Pelomonas baiyunensis TaxID=3299026 RepID=A0ABW7GZ60_9BURK